jgi:hypothetical protein
MAAHELPRNGFPSRMLRLLTSNRRGLAGFAGAFFGTAASTLRFCSELRSCPLPDEARQKAIQAAEQVSRVIHTSVSDMTSNRLIFLHGFPRRPIPWTVSRSVCIRA